MRKIFFIFLLSILAVQATVQVRAHDNHDDNDSNKIVTGLIVGAVAGVASGVLVYVYGSDKKSKKAARIFKSIGVGLAAGIGVGAATYFIYDAATRTGKDRVQRLGEEVENHPFMDEEFEITEEYIKENFKGVRPMAKASWAAYKLRRKINDMKGENVEELADEVEELEERYNDRRDELRDLDGYVIDVEGEMYVQRNRADDLTRRLRVTEAELVTTKAALLAQKQVKNVERNLNNVVNNVTNNLRRNL